MEERERGGSAAFGVGRCREAKPSDLCSRWCFRWPLLLGELCVGWAPGPGEWDEGVGVVSSGQC